MKNAGTRWQDEGLRTLALFDIDHFKTFNDTYGHLIGDPVLKLVGSHLRRAREEFDIETEAMAARFGGDEFALVASGVCPPVARNREPLCKAIKNFNLLIRDTDGKVEKTICTLP